MFGVSDEPTSCLSVHQLESYWHELDAAPEGSEFRSLSLWEMPPWNDICAELNWEFHLPDNGHFRKTEYGYCGVYRLIALASEGDLNNPEILNRIAGQDRSGTLYIGETIDLSVRLNEILRSGWGHRHEDSHRAIRMLKKIRCLDFFSKKNRIGASIHRRMG